MQALRCVLSHTIAIVFITASWCSAQVREFTDSSRKYRVDGELSSWSGSSVQLKTKDGAVVDMPINRLSKSDQTYVFAKIADILDTRFARSYSELRQQYEDERTGKVRQKKLTQYVPPPTSFRGKLAFICFRGWKEIPGWRTVDASVDRVRVPEGLIAGLSLEKIATYPSEVGTVVIVDEQWELAGSSYEVALGGLPTRRTVPGVISHVRITMIDVGRNEAIGAKTFRDKKDPDPPTSVKLPRQQSLRVVYVGANRGLTEMTKFLNELPDERFADGKRDMQQLLKPQ